MKYIVMNYELEEPEIGDEESEPMTLAEQWQIYLDVESIKEI
jgi:hypothetical protein